MSNSVIFVVLRVNYWGGGVIVQAIPPPEILGGCIPPPPSPRDRHPCCHIYIDNKEIKRVQSCKYLGVVIDQIYYGKIQVDHVKKKVIKCIIYLLKRSRPYINQYVFNAILIIVAQSGQML